jgi:hypothetical protein
LEIGKRPRGFLRPSGSTESQEETQTRHPSHRSHFVYVQNYRDKKAKTSSKSNIPGISRRPTYNLFRPYRFPTSLAREHNITIDNGYMKDTTKSIAEGAMTEATLLSLRVFRRFRSKVELFEIHLLDLRRDGYSLMRRMSSTAEHVTHR